MSEDGVSADCLLMTMLSTDGAEASAARVGRTSDDRGDVDTMFVRGGRSEIVPAQSPR